MKKEPQRMCISCNNKRTKKELIRIVIDKDGKILVDKTGKANGRGAYICDKTECLEKLIKTKRLEKIFRIQIKQEVYENIRGVIIDKTE